MSKIEAGVIIFPECWPDDVRMDVLFSPFRLRKVNPENYDAKLEFWKDMIIRYCDGKGSPCFNVLDVKCAFQRKNKLPRGLEHVICDMIGNKVLRSQSDFISDPQNTWSGWIINNLIRKRFQWSVRRLQNPVEPKDEKYVHLDVLKLHSQNLRKHLDKFAGTVITFDKIARTQGTGVNKEGLFINLLYLESQQNVFLEFKRLNGEKRIHLVKVPEKGSLATPITHVDKAVYILEQTEEDLMKKLDELETEVVKFDKQAREYVRQGKRIVAKSYLQKKHKVEDILDKHNKALDNVQSLLASIHETQRNESILDAYSIGSKTLKSLLTTHAMSNDNIDEVVDTIKESLEICVEIDQSLSDIHPVGRSEEQTFEKELEELLAGSVNVTTTETREEIKNQPQAETCLDSNIAVDMKKTNEMAEELPMNLTNLHVGSSLLSS